MFKDMAVASLIFGPPVPYGKAKGRTASTGRSCSFARFSPQTKTVGADLLTDVHANVLDVLNPEDSLLGFWAVDKKYCESSNVVSSDGSISSVQSLFFDPEQL